MRKTQTEGKVSQGKWPGRELGNTIVFSMTEEWRFIVCWRDLHIGKTVSSPVQELEE